MVMDWIRLRRGIFLVILVAVAFSASVSAQVLERESERKSEALKRVAKDLDRQSKDDFLFEALLRLSSPLFSGEQVLHYDHLVLLDYLISEDIGISCLQYLLRALRTVSNTWPLFAEFQRPALGGIINGIEPEVLVEVFFSELVRFPLDGFFCGFTALNRGFYELLEILS
ncbi:hypothetical protein Syun_009255 [Stephania yunnanensis]|uniref:Uncharacterized protein n=1 Tax=Stephania yunnanensis TaxID=152371 RepID=A0AAP0KE38_9MAGN